MSGNGAATDGDAGRNGPGAVAEHSQELLRLRSVVAAQRWDIEGLTEQRDALLRVLAERDAAIAGLQAEIAAQQLRANHGGKQADPFGDVSLGTAELLRLSADLLGLLPAFSAPQREAAPLRAAALTTLGLIDAGFYRRQCRLEIADAAAAVHYLEVGEAAGLAPNPLFDPKYYGSQVSPYEALSAGLLVHYLLHGWRRGLIPHPLFDADYYIGRHRGVAARALNPLLYFLRVGSVLGHAPHPLFNPGYYARQLGGKAGRDVASLVGHFLTAGWREGLSPSPLFDPAFYTRRHPEVVQQGWNPLLHYLHYGDAEGWMPNVGFDPAWYRAQLGPEHARRHCSLAHFVTHGQDRGLSPSPLFDSHHYFRVNPDVRNDGRNALEHYLEFGPRDGRDFHPLVDRRYFLGQVRSAAVDADCLRLLADDQACRSISPYPLFDAAYYLWRYPEVRQSEWGAFEHFLRVGAAAGCDPHPLFSTEFYGRQVDWRERSRDPLSDYLRFGAAERTSPHPLFDAEGYLRRYPDLVRDRANPLSHYLLHGGRDDERRIPHTLFDPVYFLKKLGRLPEKSHLLEFLSLPPDELVDPHPLFDCRHYLRQRPELRAAGINPLLHYMTTPAGEAADPHPLFDERFYLAQRPELAGGATPLLLHYLQEGYRDCLSPHPWFDSKYIFDRSPDLIADGSAPLLDYVIHGPLREYDPAPWFDGVSYNILHQGGSTSAVNALLDFVDRHADFRPPQPPRASSSNPASPPKANATFRADRLRAVAEELRTASGQTAPGSGRGGTPQSASPGEHIARFVRTHEFHMEGALPKGGDAPSGVALYAVYSATGDVTRSIRETIRALRQSGNAVVLINSTLERGHDFLAATRSAADVVVLRKNGGRDFASWLAVIGLLLPRLLAAEHWVLLNDSLIGPVGDLQPVWRAFAASKAGVWALSDSFERDHHLQTSFFIIRRSAFHNAAFMKYLCDYGFPEIRTDIVRQGEVGFSVALRRGGVSLGVMVPYAEVARSWLAQAAERQRWLDAVVDSRLPAAQAALIPPHARRAFVAFAQRWLEQTEAILRRGDPVNPQHFFWDTLLGRFAYPFVKRDLVTTNPARVPTVPRLPDLIEPAYRTLLTDTVTEVGAVDCVGGSVLRFSAEKLRACLAAAAPSPPAGGSRRRTKPESEPAYA